MAQVSNLGRFRSSKGIVNTDFSAEGPVSHYLTDGTATPEDLRNYFLTHPCLIRKMYVGPAAIGEKCGVQHVTLSQLLSTDKAVRASINENANVLLVDFYSTISSTEKEQILHLYEEQKHVYMN